MGDPMWEAKEKERIRRECQDQFDREARRLERMNPNEVDDWLRSHGIEPDEALRQCQDAIDRAIAECLPLTRNRT